jgi:Gpi18-like mannosyltransferase
MKTERHGGVRSRSDDLLLTGFILVAAFAVRWVLLDFRTVDLNLFFLPWYERIAGEGYRALGQAVPNLHGQVGANYSPPYYYLLYLASLFDGLLPRIYLVKGISIAFDFIAAWYMYRLVRFRYSSHRPALLAAACVLLAPSVIANGAFWGQCDIIHATFLLAALYYSVIGRYGAATALFGMALAFKAQAIVFAPFLLMLLLGSDLRLRHLLYAPIAYLVMMLPAVLAGRPVGEILTVYLQQGKYFDQLSMNAPNLYHFIPNRFYAVATGAGLLITTLACAALAALPRWTERPLAAETRVLAATMFAALAPFLLPKMHDRYFFVADVLSIGLAFYIPRLWPVPILFQVSALMAYTPIISTTLNPDGKIKALTPLAALFNTVTVGFLVLAFSRGCLRPPVPYGRFARYLIMVALALGATSALWLIGSATWEIVNHRICPTEGWAHWLCNRGLPADLRGAGWKYWALFGAMLAGALTLCLWLSRRRTLPGEEAPDPP